MDHGRACRRALLCWWERPELTATATAPCPCLQWENFYKAEELKRQA